MLVSGSVVSVRRFALLGAAILLGAALAQAQSFSNLSTADYLSPAGFSASYSSSTDYAFPDGGSAEPASPAGARGGGQYDNRSGGGGRQYAWVGGGGFNAPIGNDIRYITWGGNFTAGGGLHFSRGFSLLGEFSFFADKLPGALVAAGGGQGGNAHILALTIDPIWEIFPKATNGVYLVGGGGYYHKSTNFTVAQCCDFYGYPVNVTVSSFSSNQGGLNFGFGLYHRLAGLYGDGKMKLFAEARYTWINTPPITETNGLGRTEIIPVTFGVRW
jgi:hypothetical protein